MCTSAAIFDIKRSWERGNGDNTPILTTEPKLSSGWKEPAKEEDEGDKHQKELEFLNACYRNVKKKMKAERKRGRKQGQEAADDDQELDEEMNLPKFNGSEYTYVGYLVLDDDQMKNYPWELDPPGEDEEGDEEETDSEGDQPASERD